MKVIESTQAFRQDHAHCVATIGKFDGVHTGHQAIIGQLRERAAHHRVPSVVIVIEPHPEEFFATRPQDCPARLSEPAEKVELLRRLGVEYVFMLRFDGALSALSAEDYIQSILVEGLGIRALIAGSDFRFGHGRQGDFALLQQYGETHDFEVIETASHYHRGERVSSTAVRERLLRGDFDTVEAMLGRPYSISGHVVKGRQLGRDLGFPTCNVQLNRRNIPLHGVYICETRVETFDGERFSWPGAANIGYRPTVTDNGEAILEVHLPDFSGDLYGARVTAVFRHRLRPEVKFDSMEALQQQIAADVEETRRFFGPGTLSNPMPFQDNEPTR